MPNSSEEGKRRARVLLTCPYIFLIVMSDKETGDGDEEVGENRAEKAEESKQKKFKQELEVGVLAPSSASWEKLCRIGLVNKFMEFYRK